MVAQDEWKTWKLRWWFTVPVAVFEIIVIVAIIALERISTTRNGLVTISDVPPAADTTLSAITSKIWSYGLLWTSLPAFIMVLYRFAWDAIVSATADRQPFIELNRTQGDATNAKRTIMLDYRMYPSFYSWAIAFHHGHALIGVSLLLSLLLSIAVVPLASRLFAVSSVEVLTPLSVGITSSFDEFANVAAVNLQGAINDASAISIYGAVPPAWSTAEYAFETFDSTASLVVGNLTAPVTAYSAYLDCQIKSTSEYSATTDSNGRVTISGNDRGCEIPSKLLVVNSKVTFIAMTWSQLGCGSQAHYSRFGIITGMYSDSASNKLANLTVLSCIPSYWQTYGNLTVRTANSRSPEILSFTPQDKNSTEFRPVFAQSLEDGVPLYSAYDPSGSLTDSWGETIYRFAGKRSPQNYLNSENIKEAMEELYSSFYASLAIKSVISRTSTERDIDGTLAESVTRLFVFPPVAWVLFIIMISLLFCHMLLMIHAKNNKSILREEPKGLLGSAVLLEDSNIFNSFTALRQQSTQIVDVRKALKKNFDLKDSKCWYDYDSRSIQVEGLGVIRPIQSNMVCEPAKIGTSTESP